MATLQRNGDARQQATRRRLVAGLALALSAAAILLSWPSIKQWQQHRLAQALVERVHENPTSGRRRVASLAMLGSAGIEPLVRLAASQETMTAAVAQRELTAKVAHWEVLASEGLSTEVDSQQMVTLAQSLADHAERLGPVGERWAEQLVLRLIVRSDTMPTRQSVALLNACDKTLSILPAQTARLTPSNATILADRKTQVPNHEISFQSLTGQTLAGQLARGTPDRYREQARVVATILSPPVEPGVASRLPANLDWQSGDPPITSAKPPAKATKPAQPGSSAPQETTKVGVISVPSPGEAVALAEQLRRESPRTLLLKLPHADRYRATAIRQALQAKGFSQQELTLLKRLQSTEVSQRRTLLEVSGQLPADAARRLLAVLVEDADPSIRLEALTQFATTGDPTLTEVAAKRLETDDDPQVTELAGKILQSLKRR